MTFRTRVFLVLLTLVALVEGATFLAVLNATRNDYLQQGNRELMLGSLVFGNAIDSRTRELAVAVSVLASDFGFKRAAASGDIATIRSALINHRNRANADATMLIGVDEDLIATSNDLDGLSQNAPFPYHRMLSSERGESATRNAVVRLEDSAMQLVVTPLFAPDLKGWVAFGYAIDDSFAAQIGALTNLEVSFVSSTGSDSVMFASTLDQDARHRFSATTPADGAGSRRVASDSGDLLVLRREVGGSLGNGVDVLLALSMADILQAYGPLRMKLTGIMVIALLLSAFGARILSATVTRPILRLAAAARRISRGDYRQKVRVAGGDVVSTLANAFNDMQRDIQKREKQIVHQAQHDSLTGLPNRSMVTDRLQEAVKRSTRSGEPFSVLMLDLDGFKDINDTLGHETGDAVLIEVSRRLRSLGRACDTVARLGGDEFLILLEGNDTEAAETTAERIIDAIGQSVVLPYMQIRTDVSIGIASYPQHGENAEELQRRADIAMYTAKGSDKAVALYQPGQDEDHLRRLALVNALRDVLANDGLELHYQPKMNVSTGRICSVEALVRWTHPEFGRISPEEFVPLAEQSGHIRALTKQVLHAALNQLRLWHDEGIDIGISINLSAMDLLDETLPDMVGGLLTSCRLPPSSLTLEITESAVMKDAAYARGVMERLRAQGIRLSIDDFGTGQSSLAQLKSLPVDELKIDKSFVIDLVADGDDAAIVRSTIELGHNMGLTVTAEGVETDRSRLLLAEYRCDEIQGYLLSKPLPVERFAAWFHAQSGNTVQEVSAPANDDLDHDSAIQAV